MSEVASRLYGSGAAAEDAADALRRAGYQPDELAVLSRPEGDDAAARDAVMAAARKAGVFKRRAAELADGVVNGATAVVCRTRFSKAMAVRALLDSRKPLDPGDTSGRTTSSETEATLLSDLLGLPALGGRGDLFSRLFGLPVLTRRQRANGNRVGPTGPYKPIIPMPTLSGADGKGGYRPSIPLPLLTGGRGGYRPIIPMPTLASADKNGYRPIVPGVLLTGNRD